LLVLKKMKMDYRNEELFLDKEALKELTSILGIEDKVEDEEEDVEEQNKSIRINFNQWKAWIDSDEEEQKVKEERNEQLGIGEKKKRIKKGETEREAWSWWVTEILNR